MSRIASYEVDGEVLTVEDSGVDHDADDAWRRRHHDRTHFRRPIHLGPPHGDRDLLVADGRAPRRRDGGVPPLLPPARTHARTVTHDVEFAGCPMHTGDRVLLGEISANRDGPVVPGCRPVRHK